MNGNFVTSHLKKNARIVIKDRIYGETAIEK